MLKLNICKEIQGVDKNIKKLRLKFSIAIAVGLLPLISVWFCSVIANALHCTVNEGNVHECLVGGIDIGGLLYSMGMMGWLMLISLPMAALALIAWMIMEIICLLGKKLCQH